MKFKKFGDKNKPAIILLHGGGLSWWSYKNVLDKLQAKYYVVLPIIDGHGEDGASTFISIQDSARKLIAYIDRELCGKVFLLGGLSIGAQIVTEVLSIRKDISSYGIVESALLYPIKGTKLLTVPSYRVFYGLIRREWFSKLQAKTLSVPENMFLIYYNDSLKITKESLINIALSNGNYYIKDSIKETTANILIISGEKELKIMKKSAEYLHKLIPNSELYLAKGCSHGELSLKYYEQYLKLIKDFIENTNRIEVKGDIHDKT